MNGLFLSEQEINSLAFQKMNSKNRISSLEDAEEFIRAAHANLAGISREKMLKMLTYTGMFHEDGTLKEEFR